MRPVELFTVVFFRIECRLVNKQQTIQWMIATVALIWRQVIIHHNENIWTFNSKTNRHLRPNVKFNQNIKEIWKRRATRKKWIKQNLKKKTTSEKIKIATINISKWCVCARARWANSQIKSHVNWRTWHVAAMIMQETHTSETKINYPLQSTVFVRWRWHRFGAGIVPFRCVCVCHPIVSQKTIHSGRNQTGSKIWFRLFFFLLLLRFPLIPHQLFRIVLNFNWIDAKCELSIRLEWPWHR